MPIEREDFTGGITEIIFNCPPVNAFNVATWQGLAQTLNEISNDDTVNVLIMRAEGRGWQAGVDVKELAANNNLIAPLNKACWNSFKAVRDCSVPVISAVHGYCLGGGIGLVGASDMILAARDASFGLPEIKRGAMGGATHLARMVPLQKMRRMFFTGEPISADEAWRLGAVEQVDDTREAMLESTRALAASIAENSPTAIRLAKRALNGIEPTDIDKSYRFEQGFTLELFMSPDSQEGRESFIEKRDAKYDD